MNLEISALTDRYIQRYQEEISKKYKNVNMETLKNIWMNLNIQNPTSSVKLDKKKKKSSYQNFFGIARAEIASENPQLKFGEISKLVSQKWKGMTKEEKQTYELKADDEEEKKDNYNNFIDFIDEDDEGEENRTTFEEIELEDEQIIDEDDQFDFDDDE